MKTLALILTFLVAVTAHAQLPAISPARAGFDPSRLVVLHAITKRFVDEGQHAGVITLLARNGKLVDFQTYGYPREKIVAVTFVQHFPGNEHNFFAQFATGYYQALK